ncbi:hypothetical protein BC567DRAFT_158383 [Phyllosticta citribraziliensis]
MPNGSLFQGLDDLIPSDVDWQTQGTDSTPKRLPSRPQTRLTRSDVLKFLKKDFHTPRLDKFTPWLWLVATQDSTHISDLTHQIVRGREITVTERPELHLVWHDKRIFIKPIPPFLLSSAFWKACFAKDARTEGEDLEAENIHRSLLGFMRSYRFLIQYPSDFALAVQKGLVPPKIDFASFIRFMEDFDVDDADVSRRFQYGDLRLGRLNFWAKFVLGEFSFFKAYGNYDAYFGRFYGPLLFIFGLLTIMINAIQLGFESRDGLGTIHDNWRPLYRVGEGVCVAILLVICIIAISLLALFVFMGLRETIFALRHLAKRRKDCKPKNIEEGVSRRGSTEMPK